MTSLKMNLDTATSEEVIETREPNPQSQSILKPFFDASSSQSSIPDA